MEDIRISYNEFHKDLTLLASQVGPKFYYLTPEKVKNISYLPLLLTPEDEDFPSNNPERLVEKILHVFEKTLNLSVPLKRYVKWSEQEWLTGQLNKLEFYRDITLSCLYARFTRSRIEVMVGGMGSFNIGTFSDSVNYEAVQEIGEMLTRKL